MAIVSKFVDTMNAIEKEMKEKSVDLLVMDEVKLDIDARAGERAEGEAKKRNGREERRHSCNGRSKAHH